MEGFAGFAGLCLAPIPKCKWRDNQAKIIFEISVPKVALVYNNQPSGILYVPPSLKVTRDPVTFHCEVSKAPLLLLLFSAVFLFAGSAIAYTIRMAAANWGRCSGAPDSADDKCWERGKRQDTWHAANVPQIMVLEFSVRCCR